MFRDYSNLKRNQQSSLFESRFLFLNFHITELIKFKSRLKLEFNFLLTRFYIDRIFVSL